jgi:hypothetical protein
MLSRRWLARIRRLAALAAGSMALYASESSMKMLRER